MHFNDCEDATNVSSWRYFPFPGRSKEKGLRKLIQNIIC